MEIKDKNKRVLPLYPIMNQSFHLFILVLSIIFLILTLIGFLLDEIGFFFVLISLFLLYFGLKWLIARIRVKKYLKDSVEIDAKIKEVNRCFISASVKTECGRMPCELGIPKISIEFEYNGEKRFKFSGLKKYEHYCPNKKIRFFFSQKRGYHHVWISVLKLKKLKVLYSPKYDEILFVIDEREVFKKAASIAGFLI